MADADTPSSIDDIPVPSAGELEGLLDDSETDGQADDQQDDQEQAPKKPAKKAAKAEETTEEDEGSEEGESDEADSDQAEDEADESDESDEGDDESEETEDEKARNREGYAQRTRSAIRGQVTEKLDAIAQPQTAEQLQEQGFDPAMAEVEAIKQQMQRDKVIAYVTDLNAELNIDAQNVVKDFSVYDEKSPDYDEEFAKDVERRYKQAAKLRTDPSGEFVTNAEYPLYDFYAWAARLRGSGEKKGKVQGQKAAEKMLGSAEVESSAPPPKSSTKEDPFLKGLMGKGNHS